MMQTPWYQRIPKGWILKITIMAIITVVVILEQHDWYHEPISGGGAPPRYAVEVAAPQYVVSGSGDNLGKTKSELDSKYGKKDGNQSLVAALFEAASDGFSTGLIGNEYPGAQVFHYNLDGWSIEATFLRESGACEIIEYSKPPGDYDNSHALTDDEIKAVLAANSGNRDWKPSRSSLGAWFRADGATARADGRSIQITSAFAHRVFVQHKQEEAQHKQEEAQKLKEKLKAATSRF